MRPVRCLYICCLGMLSLRYAVLGSRGSVLGIDVSRVMGRYGRFWVALGTGTVGEIGMASHHQRELWHSDWHRNMHLYICSRCFKHCLLSWGMWMELECILLCFFSGQVKSCVFWMEYGPGQPAESVDL